MRGAAVGSGASSMVILISRIIARLYTVRRIWWDDWSHIIAGVRFKMLNLLIRSEDSPSLIDLYSSHDYICQFG